MWPSLDSFGHHGVLGRRGFAVESAAARVCREAGGRVTLNVMVRDMDLAVPHAHDTRRLEIVADGLPLFGGTQLDIDTTLVSATVQQDAVPLTGMVLLSSQPDARRSEPTPNSLDHTLSLDWWFWLGEVGGRWSDETQSFLCQLGRAKVRSEPSILRGRAELAWKLRWASTLACSAARALLNLRVGGGADGVVFRTHEVVNEFRDAGLEWPVLM